MGVAERSTAPILVEREPELARIESALEGAFRDVGGALIVEGEAGIGKSALVRAAAELARARGAKVLAARGTELESEFPFGVVRQCLVAVLREPDARNGLLSGAARLAAPVLLDASADGRGATEGVLHGLYWLLANLSADQPLLLAVDDAHWTDDPSLRFLAYLLRRVEPLPVVLLISTRPVDPAERLSALLEDPASEVLALRGLSEAAVAELLREQVDGPVDERFVRACHQASAGNPFLLSELVDALREERIPFTAAGAGHVPNITPPKVARATRVRLARLGPAAGALARAAALLGDEAPLDMACELARLDPASGAAAAEALLRAGLLAPEPRLRFRHPLLRTAVASSATPYERDAWHRRAAALLRERGASPERIAVHLLATAPPLDAEELRLLSDAAVQAARRGAPSTAATLWRRVLEEPLAPAARAECLLELGRCEYAAGGMAAALEHLDQARRMARDPMARARAVVVLCEATTRGVREFPELAELASAAAEEIRERDPELALRLEASALILEPDWRRSGERLRRLAALPGDTPGEAMVLAHLIFRRMVPGVSADEIAGLAGRAARQLDAILAEGTAPAAFSQVVNGLRWADQLDKAERLLEGAIAAAHRRGSTLLFGLALTWRAEVQLRRGRLRDAEADARAALEAGLEEPWNFARGLHPLLKCLVAQGRTEEAGQLLQAELGDGELDDVLPMVMVLLARAQVRGARGDHAGALADLEAALARRRRLAEPGASWIEDLLMGAVSHHALGDAEAARSLADDALRLARSWGTPGALGEVLRVRGRLTDGSDRLELLAEAVKQLERSPARLLHARALVDLGGALRRTGHRVQSREPLRAGYELARDCSCTALAEAARQELAASGVRVRRERLSGVRSLTPSEQRIAEMASRGSSNAEIAQALFVTVKTVEAHLTHAYQKLGITGRTELARALGAD
jgi:DNA-binding CsgD family transcriptional regulator